MATNNTLLDAIRRCFAEGVAVRAVNKLLPVERVDGEGGKVMPPTFSERQYAWEDRERGVVTLDSIASHVNRQEVLLGRDWQSLQLPIIRLKLPGQVITSYQASHRLYDALFRDALLRGQPFRPPLRASVPGTEPTVAGGETESAEAKDTKRAGAKKTQGRQAASRGQELPPVQCSEVGLAIEEAASDFATPLYQFGPHCLVYGCWDSTGSAGGLGAKFPRAVESRVTGHNARLLQGTRGKIDAARLPSVPTYITSTGDWTVNSDEAVKDEKQNPVRFKLKPSSKGVLSELNHSSVTPATSDQKTKEPLAGGVSIAHAYERWVLSVPTLRVLSFPSKKGDQPDAKRDAAGQVVLALLGLCGLSRLWDAAMWFRSGCTLEFDGKPQVELVYGRGRKAEALTVDTAQVDDAYRQAVQEAEGHGLKMQTDPLDLDPAPNLLEAYQRSRTSRATDADEAAEAEG